MTCGAHAHQGSQMQPNAHALVHSVHGAHRAGGTLMCCPHGSHVDKALLPASRARGSLPIRLRLSTDRKSSETVGEEPGHKIEKLVPQR